ncbi:MAG: thioredoxin [Sulfuriferula sp.]
MATLDLTQENFESTVLENDFVIIDFWAPWCGPCRAFAPTYDQVSENHPDIIFAKVNTEVEQAIAGSFQIRSIPTLMVFREKVIVYSQPGSLPASALEDLIAKVRELDMVQVHKEIAEEQAGQS